MKRYSRFLAMGLACVILFLCMGTASYATEETKEKLNQAKQEKEESQNKLNETNQNINTMNAEKQSLTGTLNNLNNQLTQVSENLAVLEDDIDAKEQEIEETNDRIDVVTKELEQAKETVQNQYETMKKQIKFMYERGDNLYLELLFDAGSFANLLNHSSYIEMLSSYQKKMLESYRDAQAKLEEKQAQLEKEMAKLEEEQNELDGFHAQVQAEQSKIAGMVSSTTSSINQYSNQIASAEQAADAYAAEIKAKNAEIAELEKQLREEERMIALAKASKWRDISQVTFADNDRYLLANLIYCEAGAEPYEGKVAVGSVVINRLLSSVYPDTVVGVIYQNRQFAPVLDGHLALALAENRATESCYQAADVVMSGTTNVSDCLYFRTPIPQVTPRYTIGNHIFY